MLQLKGLMTGVLLGKLQNKSVWLVFFSPLSNLLVSVFSPAPNNLSNLFKILASFIHVYILAVLIFSFRGMISGMRPSNLQTCTIQMLLPSMVLC